MDDALRKAVRAADRAEVCAAVEAVYADLQDEVDARRPRCDASGRCCHFEQYGHRLYVTTVELATFVRRLPDVEPSPSRPAAGPRSLLLATEPWSGAGCPFQTARLCTVHAARPFGCRIFFCDPESAEWQAAAYERLHGRLKEIHGRFAVPYFYVEWRRALRVLELGGAALSPAGESF